MNIYWRAGFGAALACTVCVMPAHAQVAAGEGTTALGTARLTVGAGTALLVLPDAGSFVAQSSTAPGAGLISGFEFNEDFGREPGWNVNASVVVPFDSGPSLALSGFWANVQADDSFTCATDAAGATGCGIFPLVDNPLAPQSSGVANGGTLTSFADRDVNNWGIALEGRWDLRPASASSPDTPLGRHFALGADVRGIDQDLDVDIQTTVAGVGPATYEESLDTRYYGAYAAWGGDFRPFLFASLWERLGLQSSFQLRGGVYYADTEHDGRLVDSSSIALFDTTSALSLSNSRFAFIGGLALETRKRLNDRISLSLRSEYEYYSYVPQVVYNTVDAPNFNLSAGRQNGTFIDDDDAFSARSMLRLTVDLQ